MMRLMKRDTEAIAHYRNVEKPSGYIGTVREPERIGTVYGIISPVTDSAAVQMYGERVGGMVSVTVLSGAGIQAGDILRTEETGYKVLSVTHYSDHDNLTAERTGNDTVTGAGA